MNKNKTHALDFFYRKNRAKREKDMLVEKMLKEKGDKNNCIDLDAYARGLIDMYDKLKRFKR